MGLFPLIDKYAQELVSQSKDFIFICDAQGTFLEVNAHFHNTFEWSEKELKSKRLDQWIPIEIQKISCKPIAIDHRHLINKENRFVAISWQIWQSQDQATYCGLGQVILAKKDLALITEHSSPAESPLPEDLFEGSYLLWEVLNFAPIAIFIKDGKDGFKYKLWNNAAGNLWGLPSEQALGSDDFAHLPLEQAKRLRAVDEQLLKTGVPIIVEEQALTPLQGNPRLVRTRKQLIGGRYILGMSEDFTDLRKSQERHAWAMNELQMGVFEWDLVKDVITGDDTLYELYFTDRASTPDAKKAWEQALVEEDRPQIMKEVEKAYKETGIFRLRYRIKSDKGEIKYIGSQGKVIFNDQKNPIGILGVNWDETELAKAELELKEVMNAVETASIFTVTNAQGDIINVNDNFCKISGYTREELIGKNHRIFNSGYHSKEFFKKLWETISSGKIWQNEIKNRSKTGADFWTQTIIAPTKDLSGKISKYISVRFDITAGKEAQTKMLMTSRMSSLGEMASGVAHEVNNPLAIIQLKTEQIKDKLREEPIPIASVIADSEIIERTVERIAKIIKGLRAFAKNSDQDPKQIAPVYRILEDTLELCRERFRARGIQMRASSEVKANITCRPAQISQVFMNLLNNSFDALEGLKEKWIDIQLQVESHKIKILITDSGQGIRKDLIDKVMQPFFTTKEIGKGIGLGLSVSKGIIEEHGGSLYYDPTCSNTRFVIELPIK